MTVISKVSVKQRKKKAVNCTVFANGLLKRCNVWYVDEIASAEDLSLAAEIAWRLYGKGETSIDRGGIEKLYSKVVDEAHYQDRPASRRAIDEVADFYLI